MLLANTLKENSKEKYRTSRLPCAPPDPSWSLFTHHQEDDASLQPLSPKYPGQFGTPCLSSPRVLDHNMDAKKGYLFLKKGWEPRWEGSSAPKLLVLTASPTPTA